MGSSPFQTALEAIARPLDFASEEEQSPQGGRPRLRDLEKGLRGACRTQA